MHDEETQFEQDLRQRLKGLADQAPAGAGVEGVWRRLRRRAIRRTLVGTAGATVAIAMAAAWLVPLQRGMQLPTRPPMPQIAQSPATPQPGGVRIAEAPLPGPIPADAGPQQIQAAVFGYLSSVGVSGQVLICKERGDPVYYVVSGNVRVRPEQLHDHLAAMLRGFETISIERRGRDVRCTLVAAGSTGNSGQPQQQKEQV
jgi:hypothetical protein